MEVDQLLTTLKLLIIGESGVGKSSLLLRFTDDAFDPEQAATIGVDFKVKTININGDKVRKIVFNCNIHSCLKAFFVCRWSLQYGTQLDRNGLERLLQAITEADKCVLHFKFWLCFLVEHYFLGRNFGVRCFKSRVFPKSWQLAQWAWYLLHEPWPDQDADCQQGNIATIL